MSSVLPGGSSNCRGLVSGRPKKSINRRRWCYVIITHTHSLSLSLSLFVCVCKRVSVRGRERELVDRHAVPRDNAADIASRGRVSIERSGTKRAAHL